MTAFNVVRFRLKPGREQDFVDAHRRVQMDWPGVRRMSLVKAAEDRFFIIGEWDSLDAMATARPQMIATLDSFRHMLEDQGGGLGVTDPVSGTAVLEVMGPR